MRISQALWQRRKRVLLVVAPLLGGALGCDVGPRTTSAAEGPPLQFVATTPRNGEGVGCDANDPSCGHPRDGAIVVRLNRPIEPNTAARQSISLYTASPNVGAVFFSPTYDILERTVSFAFSGQLLPRLLYQVDFALPKEPGDFGLRAYDRAPLIEGAVPVDFSFITAQQMAALPEPPAFSEPSCADIVALFQSRCAGSCCHGGAQPVMGLSLDSLEALSATAIGRVSHQVDKGDTLGTTYRDPPRFGLAMPIIEPHRPANSYLVYKLLIHEQNLVPCSGDCGPFESLPGARQCEPVSAEERERLRDWFVQGDPMPPPLRATPDSDCSMPPRSEPLDCGSMRAIERWIGNGADCP